MVSREARSPTLPVPDSPRDRPRILATPPERNFRTTIQARRSRRPSLLRCFEPAILRNNGLALRYPGHGDTAYTGMCELQVLDNTAEKFARLDPRQYHGSVYGQIAAERGYLREPGEWNFQRVRVVGSRITVELNGTRILTGDNSKLTEFMHDESKFAGRNRTRGHFGLAGHSDPVLFRDIKIRRL